MHRLLTTLAEEGFMDRDRRTGRCFLGPELYLLDQTAGVRYDVTRQARASVHRFATQTGERVFFSARRGEETVCLPREDGDFPIRSFVLHEGARFPPRGRLAGLVILSFLDDGEIDSYLARTDQVSRWGDTHSSGAVRARIAQARRDGYAINPGLLIEWSWGMAATMFDSAGQPAWALTLRASKAASAQIGSPNSAHFLLREAHFLVIVVRGGSSGIVSPLQGTRRASVCRFGSLGTILLQEAAPQGAFFTCTVCE
ncbi:IclR family transcriptional regulator [Streptomyces chartreusis]|uniref:IclR family transcriptional regulator n=1 Tax=Streptomyces chartreusis TaxID=1969 RepID=UPI00382B8072